MKFEKTNRKPTDQDDGFLDPVSGCFITDPSVSSCGRFSVDPVEEYGAAYTEWIAKGSQ